jgi:hypothetical protein
MRYLTRDGVAQIALMCKTTKAPILKAGASFSTDSTNQTKTESVGGIFRYYFFVTLHIVLPTSSATNNAPV